MLQQTSRTSDTDGGECSDLVTDAHAMATVAHVVDGNGPRGGHARLLSVCDDLCAACSRPVHPFAMAAQCGIGIHCLMPSCCTSEDVEIVNVVGLRFGKLQSIGRHRRYNFGQWADVGRASARP